VDAPRINEQIPQSVVAPAVWENIWFHLAKIADGDSDGNNCAAHSDQENNISNASKCESCNKLKMKLNDVLSELSSTYAIIDLLQIEINSKHSWISDGYNSRDKSTHDSKNQHNVKDIQENWKLVMSKHQLKLWKPTYSETLQNIKLITVTNSYAYLSNLEDRKECETIGRNLDASSNLCTYSVNVTKTNELMKQRNMMCILHLIWNKHLDCKGKRTLHHSTCQLLRSLAKLFWL
jgi:hypothetical protein